MISKQVLRHRPSILLKTGRGQRKNFIFPIKEHTPLSEGEGAAQAKDSSGSYCGNSSIS